MNIITNHLKVSNTIVMTKKDLSIFLSQMDLTYIILSHMIHTFDRNCDEFFPDRVTFYILVGKDSGNQEIK